MKPKGVPPNYTDSYAELKAQYEFMGKCFWRVEVGSWCSFAYRGCDNELVPSEWAYAFKHCPACGKWVSIDE